MKLSAYILARPQFQESYQNLLDDFLPVHESSWKISGSPTMAERLIEFAGRVCYMSFGSRQSKRTTAEYIRNLIDNGHESVLEHATWTIGLLGVSRAFTHQLVRHRVGFAFSQLSQQYHDESDARFIRPVGIEQVPEAAALWEKSVHESQETYRKLLATLELAETEAPSTERREATRALRSRARSVLPNATESAIVITANARALRHFLKVRGGTIGDIEMRCVAATLLQLIRPEAPSVFSDFSVEYPADGLPLVVHQTAEP